MDSVLWSFKTLTGFTLSAPLVLSLFILLMLCWDYVLLVPYALWLRARGARPPGLTADNAPSALIVIPSLLRKRDELTSMFATIDSVATNGYPGELVIVVSIDGTNDAPDLYGELEAWAARRAPELTGRTSLHVTGTPGRRGKPMAIEHAVQHLKTLVASGLYDAFPRVYISTDADADLGPRALEHLVERLKRRSPLTGWPARAVAGNLYIRGNAFWQGWRRFFTVEGQITLQVAREYMVTNVARHNLRWMPLSGVPGVLYCTWTEIFLQAPHFMGYMRTLRPRHWLRWWLGFAPPPFVGSPAAPVPELMAGDTDDTVSAYMAILARWKDGHFTVEPPRTPLHALVYMLRAIFIDRALRYQPEARVYTSSPTTIKALFKQRRRWNCSRIEVTGRFFRAMWFHWSLGLPAMGIMALIAKYALTGGLVYFRLPMALFKSTVLTAFLLGYTCQLAGYSMLTILALIFNGERRLWRLALALPLSPLYAICFTYAPSVVGAVNDVLLFGNVTGFAPETTLIRGGSERIALLYRLRRALLLAVRAVRHGDVPWGAFWFGWSATEFTPCGYEGWTTGKRPPPVTRPRRAAALEGPRA
jgi:cellulose synthase/poly-beta-1,6-N-acetylglucosamine synthase-like glycosyltransferase